MIPHQEIISTITNIIKLMKIIIINKIQITDCTTELINKRLNIYYDVDISSALNKLTINFNSILQDGLHRHIDKGLLLYANKLLYSVARSQFKNTPTSFKKLLGSLELH